jgi:hypothetical protein
LADISMCNDYSCPQFDDCYRAQAKPSMRQSYFMTSPRDKDKCSYFWPLEETDENSSRHRNKPSTRQDSCGSNKEH